MTSEERREARYSRRKAKRDQKKRLEYSQNDDFDWVFSYEHLYKAYRKCRRGVAWKASTQNYITHAPLYVYQTYKKLKAGRFKTSGFTEFDIHERGKVRHIRSVTITERVVQRCLCDYALGPIMRRTFIHDNGASTLNKGYDFAVRRLTQHLHEHYRKHGSEGYILIFDFSKFFDRISHKLVKGILRKEFSDERILSLAEHFIDAFGYEGLGLGSQISQVLALASANRLDHYIKERCGIRGYARYMDDGYLIHKDKGYLQTCLEQIRELCKELHITLNEKKTQIVKLTHGFTWLKVKIFLTKNGKIIRKIHRSSVTRMRQKLKKYVVLVNNGIMSVDDARMSAQSWRGHAKRFDAYDTICSMETLFGKLFGTSI